MAVITYTCTAEGCGWVQESPAKEAGIEAVVDERVAHNAETHAGEAGFTVRETWPWLVPLFILNLIWLTVSVIARLGPWSVVAVFAPQVAMFPTAPWLGLIEVLVIGLITLSYAKKGPEGASMARRAFAGLTMSAFLVMLGNVVLVFLFFALAALSFPR
ncbi:hypothetical protein GCM10027058_31380 [Microbacterium neimengense]